MCKVWLLSILISGTACVAAQQNGSAPATQSQAAVEIKYCGMHPAKPPLTHLSFDITVRNTAGSPQWFLFPAALYDKAVGIRSNAGIDVIELFSDSPEHKVTVVYFMGTMNLQPEGAGGFKGLFLPAGAEVSVHGFEIEFWGEPASPLPVQVVIADHVTLGGTPVEEWVGKKLLSATTAEVKNLALAGSKKAKDLKELPVKMTKSGEITIPDVLAKGCLHPSQ